MKIDSLGDKNIDFNKDSLVGDIGKIFTDDFASALGKAIGNTYKITELIEILNLCEAGKESEWISILDEHLEEIELLEELSEYIVQMEKLREVIRMYMCMILICPRGIALIRATFVYALIVLQYGGIESLSEIFEREKIEKESGEYDFFLSVYLRIFSTISYVGIKTFMLQVPKFLNGGNITPLEWSERESSNVNEKGLPVLDYGAWRDFNEYLCGIDGLFTVSSNQNNQPCVLM